MNDDQDPRHGETLRAFCHGRMPELLQPEYRFRPTGRQLLLLSDGQVVLLSIFAHDLPLLAITFRLSCSPLLFCRFSGRTA